MPRLRSSPLSSPARKPAADFARYLRTETTGGIVLLVATAIALLWANSPLGDSYTALRETHLGPLTIGDWVKDGLLAVFFFVAGLELKRELVVGELNSLKAAALPVIAAVGGMVVPALVALGFSWGEPGAGQAWAIPMATDIAFALGVLAIAGSALPSSVRVFLLSLAVVDDLGAIAVIAVLFTSGLELLAVLAAVALLALYAFLQHKRVTATWLYVPIAVGAWVAVHEAGVHATIAGVALGLLTRVRADEGEDEAPAARLEHRLQPWSAGLVVPLFALFAAGVPIGGDALRALVDDPIALGVVAGLVLGKVIGILGFSALAVRLRLAVWPSGAGPRDVAAVGVLGGVGFTVSLLIADLALAGEAAERAKAAVLIASLLASLIAAVLLVRRGRAHRDSD
ncbi:Na+/H+ antiporter NhaA [Actinosynnema pretiosum subsp. pretiosum]|uniref:Na(+)/H(+) antiporter NhaA n=1 Tax=Actinosynnema pretiosum subsp. pretiosum TaxID=103721 RepID=A0AA45L2L8_9PSEU|nr:Na+/H+ antiporter NhaA [Actinosynnema pretiosum subsp. pretiosum]